MADRPIADLPEEITLTRDDAATVLFALDVVDSAVPGPEAAEKVRRAVRLLTRRRARHPSVHRPAMLVGKTYEGATGCPFL